MTTAYSHTPRPIGGAISFELREDRLTVDVGRKAVEIPLASVEEVRMTYEPRNLAQKAFRTRLRLKGGRSFSFTSRRLEEPDRCAQPRPGISRLHADPARRRRAGQPAGSLRRRPVSGGLDRDGGTRRAQPRRNGGVHVPRTSGRGHRRGGPGGRRGADRDLATRADGAAEQTPFLHPGRTAPRAHAVAA